MHALLQANALDEPWPELFGFVAKYPTVGVIKKPQFKVKHTLYFNAAASAYTADIEAANTLVLDFDDLANIITNPDHFPYCLGVSPWGDLPAAA